MCADRTMKQEYLCVDDYSSGGIWYIVSATSPEAIKQVLPFLAVTDERTHWLTDDLYMTLQRTSRLDADSLPTDGPLALRLRMRFARYNNQPSPISKEDAERLINEQSQRLQPDRR